MTSQAHDLARHLNNADRRGTRANVFDAANALGIEITGSESEEYGPWELADGSRIAWSPAVGAGWRWESE